MKFDCVLCFRFEIRSRSRCCPASFTLKVDHFQEFITFKQQMIIMLRSGKVSGEFVLFSQTIFSQIWMETIEFSFALSIFVYQWPNLDSIQDRIILSETNMHLRITLNA